MYRHHKVNRMMSQARRIVRELFGLFMAEPETLAAAVARPREGNRRRHDQARPRGVRLYRWHDGYLRHRRASATVQS